MDKTVDNLTPNSLERRTQGSFLHSVQHALNGISYGLYNERNLRRDFWLMNLSLLIQLILRPAFDVVIWALFAASMVFAAELFNTAVERVVDLAANGEILDLARIAKDTAAGAVLLTAIAALAVGGYMLFTTYPWHFYLFTAHHSFGACVNAVALILLWFLRVLSVRCH